MERWSGRVGLVTGASSGIGRELTKTLLGHGLRVVACARNFDRLQDLKAELPSEEQKQRMHPIKCDVSKEDDILQMFSFIRKQLGVLDVCVNNAGLAFNSPLLIGKTEDWRQMLEVNILGLSICTREAVALMQEKNVDDGHIINVSSLGGHRLTRPSSHFYGATKFAVRALTEGLRREIRETGSGIRITSVSPGMVDTEFQQRMFSNDVGNAAEGVGYYISPDVAKLEAKDIVDIIIYTLSAPSHVEVHDVLVRPTKQKI